MTDDEIARLREHVKELLDARCQEMKYEFRLNVLEVVRDDDGWILFVVTPDREGVHAYQYAEALAHVETSMRRYENVEHVLLLPSLAA